MLVAWAEGWKAFEISWKEKEGILEGDLADRKAWVVEPVDM